MKPADEWRTVRVNETALLLGAVLMGGIGIGGIILIIVILCGVVKI